MSIATRPASRPGFICSSCGALSLRWQGRCATCEDWNSLVEAPPDAGRSRRRGFETSPLVPLEMARRTPAARLASGFAEVDRVLGGGFVPGSLVLLGGDPGVGKSTLALQVAHRCLRDGRPAMYCSGEESAAQLGMRAGRLGCDGAEIEVLIETDLGAVAACIAEHRPCLAVLDSVQTLSDPETGGLVGSPAQVRAVVARLVALAKETGVPLLLIGHVTKEGAIAGPRTLEHMVDVVLYLEGERLGEQRLLRGVKNRFGSTGELGLLAMEASGFRELDAQARSFWDQTAQAMAGAALTVTCEGLRPLAVEVQALTLKSVFGMPRRTASGFDVNRLHMLLAVLERRAGLALSQIDVFVNAAGGLRIIDPAADLAMAMAVAGALGDRVMPAGCALLGEVGLGGEVRRVSRLDARLAEAAALGISTAIVPERQSHEPRDGLRCFPVATVRDALRLLA